MKLVCLFLAIRWQHFWAISRAGGAEQPHQVDGVGEELPQVVLDVGVEVPRDVQVRHLGGGGWLGLGLGWG